MNFKKHVVLFSCNVRYFLAVVSSVISIRKDGGYMGDILVFLDTFVPEQSNTNNTITHVSIESFRQYTLEEGQAQNISFDPLMNLEVFTTDALMDSLFSYYDDSSTDKNYLRSIAPSPACIGKEQNRLAGLRSYYLKMLVFHPMIAERWDIALFLDGCMTFRSPHVHDLFEMPQIEGHILAQQDLMRYALRGLEGSRLKCTFVNATLLKELEMDVGKPLQFTAYFASGLMLYDTSLLAPFSDNHNKKKAGAEEDDMVNYRSDNCTKTSIISGSNNSSDGNDNQRRKLLEQDKSPPKRVPLIELYEIYHKYGSLFAGDQQIVSIYWYYIRKLMWNIPMIIPGTNRVPYEFFAHLPLMRDEPHIITAGNIHRPICMDRPAAKQADVYEKHLDHLKAMKKI